MNTISVSTRQRCELVDITPQIHQYVSDSRVSQGAVMVYVPHTTAGITINENADPDVKHDLLLMLEKLAPRDDPGFRHSEGNSDAHVKASLMGASQMLLIADNRLVLGTWQGVFLAEFDGPRQRKIHMRVLPS